MTRYPLTWPDGWGRTPASARKQGAFNHRGKSVPVSIGVKRITAQLGLMGVKRDDSLISTDIPLTLDGLPRSDKARTSDPGAAVYWRKNRAAPALCMAIDIYRSVADNLAAIAATLEAIRAIERHGGSQIQERTFRGFTALPASTPESTGRDWREVLDVDLQPALWTKPTEIEIRYRRLAKTRHPDAPGGSAAAMAELNKARTEYLEWLRSMTSGVTL